MDQFTLQPPQAVLYIAGAVVAVALLSVFLKRGETVRKAVGIGFVVLFVAVIVYFLYRPVTITVGPEGIATSGTGSLEVSWADVTLASYERDLQSGEYRPTTRITGTAIGDFRTGRFRLAGGGTARLLMERTDAAVVLVTGDMTYLFGPRDVEGLAESIGKHLDMVKE